MLNVFVLFAIDVIKYMQCVSKEIKCKKKQRMYYTVSEFIHEVHQY